MKRTDVSLSSKPASEPDTMDDVSSSLDDRQESLSDIKNAGLGGLSSPMCSAVVALVTLKTLELFRGMPGDLGMVFPMADLLSDAAEEEARLADEIALDNRLPLLERADTGRTTLEDDRDSREKRGVVSYGFAVNQFSGGLFGEAGRVWKERASGERLLSLDVERRPNEVDGSEHVDLGSVGDEGRSELGGTDD